MNSVQILEQLLNGVVTGSMYALMGAGLALVYGTMRVMNFAHGELFMVGGYGLFLATSVLHIPMVLAFFLAIALAAGVAALVEYTLLKPLMPRSNWELATIVTTLGLSLALQSAALNTIGENYLTLPYVIEGSISFAGMHISFQRLFILAAAAISIAIMHVFLQKSRTGWALRATSQDAEAASIVGIPTQRIFLIAFTLSGALAGIAAVTLSPIQSVSPWMGAPMAIKAFVVVVLGGMGSFGGCIIAGFIVGIVEALGTAFTSSEWRDLFSFAILIAIIWFRPEGMFGHVGRRA